MAEMLPIVGFVGFKDGATTIGGGAAATGGVGGPIGGLLGGVVVIASDFLFLVVWTVINIQFLVLWSVNCAQYPIPCCCLCTLSYPLLLASPL